MNCWKTGRKIVTKETQEGCLSFSIKVFQNFLSAEKLVEAVEKNFSTALGLPLCERESFCVLASRGGKWYDSHVFFVEFGACHEKTGRWNIGPCVSNTLYSTVQKLKIPVFCEVLDYEK